MKILALRNCYVENPKRRRKDGYGGIGYYRTVKPAEQLKGTFDIEVWGRKVEEVGDTAAEQWGTVFKDNDIIWSRYFDSATAASAIFACRDYFKKKVVIDIDDNYLDVHESNPAYEAYQKGKHKRAHVGAVFSLADALTVSTEPLKKLYQEHIKEVHGIDKPVYVIPNFNDVNDWNFTPAPKDPEKVVIGYAGSVSHDDDLKLVLPAIVNLMRKYPNLHFQMLGIVQNKKEQEFFKNIPDDIRNRMWIVGVTSMFSEYPEWLSKQPWDIGIAPLVDTPFTRCKSHIKWMEYAMYEIPCVASRVYPYSTDLAGRDTVIDGETGFLCGPTEWEAKLERLILNKSLREQIGKQAKEYVVKTWQYKDSKIEETWEQIIKDLSVNEG